VVVLVVVAALVLAADRGGLWLAERAATERAREQGLTGAAVDISGTPFLTQLAARDLREMTITGDSYRRVLSAVGPGETEITAVRVLARDVAVRSRDDATAAQVTVEGVVPYAAVSAAAGSGVAVTAAAGDQVQVVQTVEIFGRSLQVRALAGVSAEDGQIVVRPTEATVEGGGRLGDIASEALLRQLVLRYPAPDLPPGLMLTGVAPTADGLAVTLAGRDISLNALG
jgi:hypothetical protein